MTDESKKAAVEHSELPPKDQQPKPAPVDVSKLKEQHGAPGLGGQGGDAKDGARGGQR